MRAPATWSAIVLVVASCATSTRERCPLLTASPPGKPLPAAFAEVDALLVQRTQAMIENVERLNRSLTARYKETFLEELAPHLCDLMAEARVYAYKSAVRDAGTHYQSLLVVTTVMQLEVALAGMADHADRLGQVSTQIAAQLEVFDEDMAPLMAAALSLDRARLAAELPEGLRRYEAWLHHLEQWGVKLQLGEERVRVARVLWDTFMMTAAAYDMAGSLANAAASAGRLPPAMGAMAGAGGATVTVNAAVLARALKALKALVASGALDGAIVAGIGRLGHQMAAQGGGLGGQGRVTNPSKSDSPIWKRAEPYRNGLRKSGDEIWDWDAAHNDIEAYDKRGRHLGSRDPITGEIYKPAVPGRRIDL